MSATDRIGRWGEQKVFDFFSNQGLKIKDTRYLPEYQEKDVDCIIEYDNGNSVLCEIKTDQRCHLTGNFFVENISDLDNPNSIKSRGWYSKCEADIMVIVSK